MMKQMEKKSCVRFREKTRPPSGHHLEIQVNTSFLLVDLVLILISDWLTQYHTDLWLVDQVHSSTSCVQQGRPRFSAAVYAEPPQNEKVILYSAYKLADKRECWGENRGGLLHEMFHLFGIMHTQMRRDRDEHITILRQNIQSQFSQEYDVSKYY